MFLPTLAQERLPAVLVSVTELCDLGEFNRLLWDLPLLLFVCLS